MTKMTKLWGALALIFAAGMTWGEIPAPSASLGFNGDCTSASIFVGGSGSLNVKEAGTSSSDAFVVVEGNNKALKISSSVIPAYEGFNTTIKSDASWTMVTVVKPVAVSGKNIGIWGIGNAIWRGGKGVMLSINTNGQLDFSSYSNKSVTKIAGTSDVADIYGGYQVVAVRCDSSANADRYSIWVNGQKKVASGESALAQIDTGNSSTDAIQFGCAWGDITQFSGYDKAVGSFIDEVAAWNSALTDEQMQEVYTAYTSGAVINVAKVGEQGYATLQEAFDAASEGQIVTLLLPVSGDLTIPEGKNVDAGSIGISGAIAIGEGSTLTVSGNRTTQGIAGPGTFVVSSGTITANNKSGGYAVDGATIQMDGGTFALNGSVSGGFSEAASDPTLNDAKFVLKTGDLTCNNWVNLAGTLEFYSDEQIEKGVLTAGKSFRGSPSVTKSGSGAVFFKASPTTGAKFTSLTLNDGTLKLNAATTVESLISGVAGRTVSYNQETKTYSLADSMPVAATTVTYDTSTTGTFTTGAGQTAWLTGWSGESDGANKRMIGPDGTIVPMIFQDDSQQEATKWHPHNGNVTKRNTFSISAYVNLDKAEIITTDRDYGIIWAMGSSSGNEVVLAFDAEKNLVAGNLSNCTLATDATLAKIPASQLTSGYHLVTVAFDTTSGVKLVLDDGEGDKTATNEAMTSAPANNGFQVGGVYGGTVGKCSIPKNVGIAALLMFDSFLTKYEIRALSTTYPVDNTATIGNLDIGSATVEPANLELTLTGAISGTGTLNLNNTLTVDGSALIMPTINFVEDAAIQLVDNATLTVTNKFADNKVVSSVQGKEVDFNDVTKVYSLVDPANFVAKIGMRHFATLEEAIDASLGRPITLLANATGPAGCYLINANGHTFSVGAGLSEVHWTRTDGVMYKVTTTADATVGQKRVESNKYDTVAKFDAAAGVNVNVLFIPATTTLPKGSKVTIQSIGLSYRNSGYPESITLARTTSSSMSNTGTDTVRVGADNGGVRWVRYAFDDVEVTVGEEIAISAGTFDTYFTAVAETDTTALRKEQFKTTETLIYEIQYTVTKIASSNVVTVTINGETTGYPTIEAAIEAAANATEGAVITLADATADAPAGFVKGENGVLTAAKYIVISPSSYVSNWQTYVGARAESPVADGITFGVKNADEIYAAYPVNADATDGTPRNDAESIHKWIGLMQKLGTKYFVLGGRWVDVTKGAYDRTTLIPGIAVYPKIPKEYASPLDVIASDLYYACHYKDDGQIYVWDPSDDGIYVGLFEEKPDSMEDVRHFQPNCVVSRMDFYGEVKNTTARNYQKCIADFQTKIVKAETQPFSGDDRYVAWTAQCKGFRTDGLPDVCDVMTARLNSINTARGAKELLNLIYLGVEPREENNWASESMPEALLTENKASLYDNNWEVFLPFGHGTPDGFAGLDSEEFAKNTGLIKFFMANIPCLTGSETANANAASIALANPTGGSLVSVNNTSYGYLTEAGITKRYCGLSDELADHCLDTYVGGATAGESWRNAISVFAGKVLSTKGFSTEALTARGHNGESTVTLHKGKEEIVFIVPDKNYVIAAMIEENLYGDPLVKIQTTSKTTSIAATASRSARDHGVCADEFTSTALAEFNKDDGKSLTVTGACTTSGAIEVPEGKTLAVENATLTASTITVDGTFVGAGTVNANFEFGENATLDVSRLTKLTIGANKTVTCHSDGISIVVPAMTHMVPAVKSLLIAEQSTGTAFEEMKIKSVKAHGSDAQIHPIAREGNFAFEKENGKTYLVDESNVIVIDHFLTSLNAKVDVVFANGKVVEMVDGRYEIPAGSKVVITVEPDAEHTGDKATATVDSAANLNAIISALQNQIPNQKYTGTRAAATVFYNAGAHVEYSGAMTDKVVNSEGHNTQILDGDTVIFDGSHAVPSDIIVGADPKGAKLVFEKDVTFTTEQTTTLFTGKDIEIHADHVLTFMPGTTEGFKLGNCTMDKGMAAFAAGGQNNENNIFYLDSIVGTTLLDFRPEVEIRSLNDDKWIHFHTRVTGGATVTGNVRILGDARVIVKRSEYITVTGDVTAQVVDAAGKPVEGEYHRLTIDAMDAMVEWWDDNGTPRLKPVNLLKLKNKATADAIVGRINLIAPEVKDENGELILWQLDTLDDGMIVMKRLEYVVRDGFFMNGILGKDEYADWKYNSAFDQSVTKIQATCPAELKFDFTGAAEGAVITVDKPIELSGTGKLTFDVPEGKTVVVTGTISGTEGVRKSGKGTLIFGGTADNTFEGSLVVSEGAVRTTKAHGYSMHRTLHDGTVENPEIDVHTSATLDVGNVCDLDNLTIISAGTITNSVHDATQIGKIKTLTLKGDTTICGHTFGMAKDSKIVLEGHKLTIAMERGKCVTVTLPDETTEVHDHEFELNNTQVSGGKDNLDDPDIVVIQGTLSCEGSTYDSGTKKFTRGLNNLGNASLYISKAAAIRLDADLMVKRLQILDAMNPVTVKCNVTPEGQPTTEHTHTFPKIWEESVKPDANPTRDADNQYFGKIIIRMELRGGLVAPRAQFGHPTDGGSRHWFDGTTINDPLLHKVILGKGEYIDCAQECDFTEGYVFTMFFMDWSGETGARRIFHGWEKYSQSHGLADIVNPYAIKIENDGTVKATLCDWYPYGAWSFRDDPCDKFNTLPLADNDWAYAMPMWPLTTEDMIHAKTLVTTITTMDGAALYTKNGDDYTLNGSVLNITNNLLNTTCRRGDGKLEFVVDEKWLVDNMGREEYEDYVNGYAYGHEGGNGTISRWLNAEGKNGIERWQSYMLGLDPESKDSLPVLAVRNDVPPSVQKEDKTFVNVKVGGIAPRGYQYISPVYQIEELDPETMAVLPDTVTPWQKSVNFQVEVPTKTDAQGRSTTSYDYLKYFRVNVSFQGSDGMN